MEFYSDDDDDDDDEDDKDDDDYDDKDVWHTESPIHQTIERDSMPPLKFVLNVNFTRQHTIPLHTR